MNAGGFEAGIFVPSGGTGIVINAGANDAVSLRGLTIEGGGTGYNGIVFNSGQSLTVQNCVIRHMSNSGNAGIYFAPTASSSLFVSHTVVSDNGYAGIWVFPSGSGAVSAVFNDVEANNNDLRHRREWEPHFGSDQSHCNRDCRRRKQLHRFLR